MHHDFFNFNNLSVWHPNYRPNRIVVNSTKNFYWLNLYWNTTVAGTTNKSDGDINEWNAKWLVDNPTYNIVKQNCQKYAVEFIVWLTDGRYRSGYVIL